MNKTRLEKREYDSTRDMVCPNCRRVIVEAANYHNSLGTCVFCDLNQNGESDE